MEEEHLTDATSDATANAPARLTGRAVEDAAVAWVMDYERRQGRLPVDRRYDRGFAADLESTGPDGSRRLIEIKASATSYRGWFLPLEPVQFEHAGSNPGFFIYVVENVGQRDPASFTLRILDPEHLQRLVKRFAERRYFEVSWPSSDNDATPIQGMNPDATVTPVVAADPRTTAGPPTAAVPATAGAARSAPEAVVEALTRLGGEATIAEVAAAIEQLYPGRWKDVSVTMADLTFPGSASSGYPPERRVLERVAPGRYRLRSR